ncbi:hypothetical protein SNEBB_004019 [Seison nebaliae]|nr:hypothetical protein SNEBB_004019 [Seison nebaliae]
MNFFHSFCIILFWVFFAFHFSNGTLSGFRKKLHISKKKPLQIKVKNIKWSGKTLEQIDITTFVFNLNRRKVGDITGQIFSRIPTESDIFFIVFLEALGVCKPNILQIKTFLNEHQKSGYKYEVLKKRMYRETCGFLLIRTKTTDNTGKKDKTVHTDLQITNAATNTREFSMTGDILKVAIIFRVVVQEQQFAFIATHSPAHDQNLDKRNKAYHHMMKKTFSSDLVIIAGDLNYRINHAHDLVINTIRRTQFINQIESWETNRTLEATENMTRIFVNYDQLNFVREVNDAYFEFYEPFPVDNSFLQKNEGNGSKVLIDNKYFDVSMPRAWMKDRTKSHDGGGDRSFTSVRNFFHHGKTHTCTFNSTTCPGTTTCLHGIHIKNEKTLIPPIKLFYPTFKYDVGTNRFDSSHKQRMPSWTDRILYRYLGDEMFLHPIQYDSLHNVTISDHKPVFAQYRIVFLNNLKGKYTDDFPDFYDIVHKKHVNIKPECLLEHRQSSAKKSEKFKRSMEKSHPDIQEKCIDEEDEEEEDDESEFQYDEDEDEEYEEDEEDEEDEEKD